MAAPVPKIVSCSINPKIRLQIYLLFLCFQLKDSFFKHYLQQTNMALICHICLLLSYLLDCKCITRTFSVVICCYMCFFISRHQSDVIIPFLRPNILLNKNCGFCRTLIAMIFSVEKTFTKTVLVQGQGNFAVKRQSKHQKDKSKPCFT